uniref:Putative radical SAM superfamily protein n=1 Tax=viral metagenome TaxID=1070528 RepID=A0A6H1Z8X9_9ZZZZ
MTHMTHMTQRLIYVGGIRGTGKTMFCLCLGTAAEVGFIAGAPSPLAYPWPTSAVKEGQSVWPGEWTVDGNPRAHDFSQSSQYRALLGLPADATICRISGDGFSGASRDMPPEQREKLLRDVQIFMLQHYDFVVHDMWPQFAPREDERVVALAAPAAIIAGRAATPCWGGRAPFNKDQFIEEARKLLWNRGQLWSKKCRVDAFWWDGGAWIPMQEWLRNQIADLQPWYHYFELGGIPTGTKGGLNGEGKWQAIRKLLPEDLRGLRVLDIGANAGYNTFQAAAAGAQVLAIEPDSRFRTQFDLVCTAGPYGPEASNRVVLLKNPAQKIDLSDRYFDVAIMSAVHYHINRSDLPGYREPRNAVRMNDSWKPMSLQLLTILEDVLESARLIIVVTNTDHFYRKSNAYQDANPQWIANILRSIGFGRPEIHPGFGKSAIVTAYGRGDWTSIGPEIPRVAPGPRKLTLMLGWRCNSACVQCWQMVARRKGQLLKQELSVEAVKALVDRYRATLRDIELCSFGEPTAHPGFGEIIRIFHDGLKDPNTQWRMINLITNGALLHRFQELGDLPGMLTVSIDAPTDKLYSSIRKGLDLNQVLKNARTLAARSNHQNRTIGVNMTVFERNAGTIVEMAQLVQDIGLDYLAILRAEALTETDISNEELQASDPRVPPQLQQVRERFPELALYDYFTGTTALPEPPTPSPDNTPSLIHRYCQIPWTSMDIDQEGRAHPCCRSHRVSLGKATQSHDPWLHPLLTRLRVQLATDTLDPNEFQDCAKCPMRGTPWSY